MGKEGNLQVHRQAVCKLYVSKIWTRLLYCFDGYENDPSTKDQEPLRRSGKVCANI